MLKIILLYLILGIITIIILFNIYFRLRYPFWSRQPVFNYHNLIYWLFPPGIIQHKKPEKNKFYNPFISFNKITILDKTIFSNFVTFVQLNYLKESDCYYKPSNEEIRAMFMDHHSYISLKTEKNILYDNNKKIVEDKILGCMTTRKLNLYLKKNDNIKEKLRLGYVDYLCVDKKSRNKNIAPEVIYSHYVNCRYNDNIDIFCFKREGAKNGYVPMVSYNSYFYDIKDLLNTKLFKSPRMELIKIVDGNIKLLHSFLPYLKKYYDNLIIPDLSVITKLINLNYFNIYLVMIDKVLSGIYIFTDTSTTYKLDNKNKRCINLISSLNLNLKENEFILLFKLCLLNMSKKFSLCLIDNIGNNSIILKSIIPKYNCLTISVSSYYFYNFAIKPLDSEKLCIIV
jgi:hypothetical protein